MATIVSRGDECNEIECMYEKTWVRGGCSRILINDRYARILTEITDNWTFTPIIDNPRL